MLVGLIMKETCGFLVEITIIVIYKTFFLQFDLLISDYWNDLWKFDGEFWVWMADNDTFASQFGIYGEMGVLHPSNCFG
jgi:hypothetical protein